MAFFYSPFRKGYAPNPDLGNCPFCDPKVMGAGMIRNQKGVPVENRSYVWVVNQYPRFEGHTMVVPKRHILVMSEESEQELIDRQQLINIALKTLQKAYPGSGAEIFLQLGEESEQSVRHLHWHIVPARHDDPLRSFQKIGQFYTPDENGQVVLKFPIPIQHAKESLLQLLAKTIGLL